ncbi:sensor histidine kinase [Aureispira anguillae]|uniref:histidine kinase n=1 Tax=Aureispira anguillae TaxID=2864201 RepID=A0A916DTN4_9BACT|nr:sensor histidine kinase [Aureispira anguillae]BDS11621.1 sensor histidine kinase [Aureispira anguillae]
MKFLKNYNNLFLRNVLIVLGTFYVIGAINVLFFIKQSISFSFFILPTFLGILIAFLITKNTILNQEYLKEKERVSLSLREKEILLKEVHHRVKNNLQIITSLLGLQSSFIPDEHIKELFQHCQYRINSMAIVHEILYQDDNLATINLQNYLEKLLGLLLDSMKGKDCDFELRIETQNIELNIDTIIPLGLLINECFTNSLKYGYKDKNKGILYVKIKKLTPPNLSLEIGDYGTGYSPTINFRTSNSLGLKIIKNLSIQLLGEIKRDNSKKGTHYSMDFQQI